jgi:hypothetical protein
MNLRNRKLSIKLRAPSYNTECFILDSPTSDHFEIAKSGLRPKSTALICHIAKIRPEDAYEWLEGKHFEKDSRRRSGQLSRETVQPPPPPKPQSGKLQFLQTNFEPGTSRIQSAAIQNCSVEILLSRLTCDYIFI